MQTAGNPRCAGLSVLAVSVLCVLISLPGLSQNNAPATPPTGAATQSSDKAAPEVSSSEETTTFKVKVNLVEVRVVVRDAEGHAIGTLKQEDFQLLDNGKPQVISKFSMEQAGTNRAIYHDTANGPSEPPPVTKQIVPQHFIAYLFDDVHMKLGDLSQARNAAKQQLAAIAAHRPGGHITDLGSNATRFHRRPRQAAGDVGSLTLHPLGQSAVTPCPNISYYMADLIQNKHDQQALETATQDALDCAYADNPQMYNQANTMAQTAAIEELNRRDDETRLALDQLNNVIRRMAALPGERIIILASPGFINPDEISRQSEMMERAVKAKVIINTLDVRGLYTEFRMSARRVFPLAATAGVLQKYRNSGEC